MAHSKSVSWHSSPITTAGGTNGKIEKQHELKPSPLHETNNNNLSEPITVSTANNPSTATSQRQRGPSLSISSTESGQMLNVFSPTKKRPRIRNRIKNLDQRNSKCRSIDSYSFNFPPSSSSNIQQQAPPPTAPQHQKHRHKHSNSIAELPTTANTTNGASSPFSSDTDDKDSATMSPHSSEDSSISSPYIYTSQPNLQEVFIALANKERRVLEAKEQLANAESELTDYKSKWQSILEIPYPFGKTHKPNSSPPLSPFELNSYEHNNNTNTNNDPVVDLAINSPPRTPPSRRRRAPHQCNEIFSPSSSNCSSTIGKAGISGGQSSCESPTPACSNGLGLNILYHRHQSDPLEQDAIYEKVCQNASEIDSINNMHVYDDEEDEESHNDESSSNSIFLNFLLKVKSTMEGVISRHSIKSWLSTLNPFDSMNSSGPPSRIPIDSSNVTTNDAYTTSMNKKINNPPNGAILFPRLSYVNRYIDAVC